MTYDNEFTKSGSYNVNVFDIAGKWYETGLLIMSNEKLYIKLTEGQFELIPSDDSKYKYVLKGKQLYVK